MKRKSVRSQLKDQTEESVMTLTGNKKQFGGLSWWLSWYRICLQCRRSGFDPWVRKILTQYCSKFSKGFFKNGPHPKKNFFKFLKKKESTVSCLFERTNWYRWIINIQYLVCLLYVLSCVRLFSTPWTVAYQAPLSMGIPRQEYWSGLLCPPPVDLPNPEIKPRSPTLLVDSLPAELPGKPG